MIQANELRIGSVVYDAEFSRNDVIIGIEKDRVSLKASKFPYTPINKIHPIRLTPEILEKAGFVSNPYQDRYELGDIHVQYCGYRNICWIEGMPHIEYLHQLQNFVYFKTGKEPAIEL